MHSQQCGHPCATTHSTVLIVLLVSEKGGGGALLQRMQMLADSAWKLGRDWILICTKVTASQWKHSAMSDFLFWLKINSFPRAPIAVSCAQAHLKTCNERSKVRREKFLQLEPSGFHCNVVNRMPLIIFQFLITFKIQHSCCSNLLINF